MVIKAEKYCRGFKAESSVLAVLSVLSAGCILSPSSLMIWLVLKAEWYLGGIKAENQSLSLTVCEHSLG